MSKFPCQWLVCAISSQLLPEQILIPVFLLAHCYFLSCYFFSYLPTVSFFPVTLFILLPKWTVTFFSCFFFSHLSTVTFFPVTFFSYLPTVTFFPVTFFPVTFFPVTFFPTWNCYFLSCYLFSCYFLSVHLAMISSCGDWRQGIGDMEVVVVVVLHMPGLARWLTPGRSSCGKAEDVALVDAWNSLLHF